MDDIVGWFIGIVIILGMLQIVQAIDRLTVVVTESVEEGTCPQETH